jgi:hypothetical protein
VPVRDDDLLLPHAAGADRARPFTSEDFVTGYSPVAITERITMLAIHTGRQPGMIVSNLERPDAESAPGAAALSLHDWADGSDPNAATAHLLDTDGRYAISDSAWAMHPSACRQRFRNRAMRR